MVGSSTLSTFVCLPPRLGVLFTALVAWLSSLFYLCFKPQWYSLFQSWCGGYSLASKVANGVVQYSGLLFGIVGILGAWYNRRDYVVYYNAWQFVRIAGWIVMYIYDVPLVSGCEEFVNNITGMTQRFGWHDRMYELAMAGQCSPERVAFFTCSIIAILYYIYCVVATNTYTNHMDKVPRHLLRPPKDLPTGTFYAHSVAERSYMNGTWGNHDQSIGHGPPLVPGAPGMPPPFTGAGGFV
jgi:hypothetical protein